MHGGESDWKDVPYDPANFSAKSPMTWRVDEEHVHTFAYRVQGSTMYLSFMITFSTLEGSHADELYLRIPGGHLPTRAMAGTVWIGSPSIKECGQIEVRPGESMAVVMRGNQQAFPSERGFFFLYGQLLFSVS